MLVAGPSAERTVSVYAVPLRSPVNVHVAAGPPEPAPERPPGAHTRASPSAAATVYPDGVGPVAGARTVSVIDVGVTVLLSEDGAASPATLPGAEEVCEASQYPATGAATSSPPTPRAAASVRARATAGEVSPTTPVSSAHRAPGSSPSAREPPVGGFPSPDAAPTVTGMTSPVVPRPAPPSAPEARDELDALTDLVREVSSQRNVEDTLDVALRQCLSLTASEFGFIGLIRASQHGDGVGELEIVAIHGFHPAPHFFAEHRVIPLKPNIFNTVVLENRPVRTADAAADPHRVGQPSGHPPVGAFMGVPLRLDGAPIGMIGLANRAVPYEDDHERLVLTYASLISVLVHNAQLYEQLQQTNTWLERLVTERTSELAQARDALAEKASRLQVVLTDTVDTQETERRRIAADLHDGVNQLIVGALLELTSSRHRVEAGQHDAALGSLDSARAILSDVETELRRVVHDLHPPVLEGLGLTAGIREVADRFAAFSGIDCTVEVTGRPVRLGAGAETSLYRLVQEALKNVAVHSGARNALVRLAFEADEGCLTVSVSDDGTGFDPADAERTAGAGGRLHLGLGSMRRRVETLEGRWGIESTPGGGTTIRACVPLP